MKTLFFINMTLYLLKYILFFLILFLFLRRRIILFNKNMNNERIFQSFKSKEMITDQIQILSEKEKNIDKLKTLYDNTEKNFLLWIEHSKKKVKINHEKNKIIYKKREEIAKSIENTRELITRKNNFYLGIFNSINSISPEEGTKILLKYVKRLQERESK